MASVLPGPASAQDPGHPPYRDVSRSPAERARDLLERMTPEEKFWQLYMTPGGPGEPALDYPHGVFGLQTPRDLGPREDARRTNTIQRDLVEATRLGIPMIPFEEALHGLHRPGATVFPQAIALAATWDTALVGRVAGAIARETLSRGFRQVLSPVVNIASDVRWGRTEETYGEDPYLASAMARAFVEAFESRGVVATPKHFVANVGAGGRDSYPVALDERHLEAVHFPPFRSAVLDAGARSVMTAYNSVGGVPATQNRWLLRDVLKGAWGFEGFVISDMAATGGAAVLHGTESSATAAGAHALEAGLDVVFQSAREQHRPYLRALTEGLVDEVVVDSAVARVLTVKFALGLFEEPFVDPDRAEYWNGHPEHRALAREAARASIVLLRNERAALPLPASPGRVAVLGTDAVEARLGGYSGPGIAPVSILDGLREALGPGADVPYASGPGRTTERYVVVPDEHLATTSDGRRVPGLTGSYFTGPRLEGEPRFVRVDPAIDMHWTFNAPGPGLTPHWYSVRWTGTLTVPAGGVGRIGVEGNDGWRLYLDGELLAERWFERSYGIHLAEVELEPGTRHDVVLEYFESTGNGRVRLVWDAGVEDDGRERIEEAATLAAGSDVAVVVAGIEEGEFRDRAVLGLPGRQEEMIRAVAATGTPTVVVLVGGSAVTMSAWIEDVDAVLLAWYGGEEGGRAVADVLVGDASPAGRLPVTFPLAEGQLPLVYNHRPTGRGDDYLDLTGQPLFPFGYGLSYTRFAYSDLTLEPSRISPGDTATVRLRVRNEGARAGDEVVQLYLRDELATVVRPVMELAGFRRIRLEPGEEREVALRLGPEALEVLDREMRRVVEPGTFSVMVGASAADIRLRGTLEVLEGGAAGAGSGPPERTPSSSRDPNHGEPEQLGRAGAGWRPPGAHTQPFPRPEPQRTGAPWTTRGRDGSSWAPQWPPAWHRWADARAGPPTPLSRSAPSPRPPSSSGNGTSGRSSSTSG